MSSNSYDDEETSEPEYRKNVRCRIFWLHFQHVIMWNEISSDTFAQHKMIDCIVTTAGGILIDP